MTRNLPYFILFNVFLDQRTCNHLKCKIVLTHYLITHLLDLCQHFRISLFKNLLCLQRLI